MTRKRLTPNLFGIPFGLCGLAGVWHTADSLGLASAWAPDLLYLLAALVWAPLSAAYAAQFVRGGRSLRAELADPVFAPFVSLQPIIGMLLGLALANQAS